MLQKLTLTHNEYNRILKFQALNMRNDGNATVICMGEELLPNEAWSYPNLQGIVVEEKLTVLFQGEGERKLTLMYQ